MSIGGAKDLRTEEEREGNSVCQNSIQIITVLRAIIFNIHLLLVGHTIARPYIYMYVATFTYSVMYTTGSRQLSI